MISKHVRTRWGSIVTAMAAIALITAARPVAHHSRGAHYDESRTITLKGTVTRVEWSNPHIFFHIDTASDSGNATAWAVEFVGPNMLYRAGWRKDTVQPGDVVTFEAFPARNGSHTAYMQTIAFADGRVFGGTPQGLSRLEPPRPGVANR